jgi:hypothetical protein
MTTGRPRDYNTSMLSLAPGPPIIVRLAEEPVRGFGLGDVLMGALGVTGVMLLGALVLGLLLGGAIIGLHKLRRRWHPEDDEPRTQQLGLTGPGDK